MTIESKKQSQLPNDSNDSDNTLVIINTEANYKPRRYPTKDRKITVAVVRSCYGVVEDDDLQAPTGSGLEMYGPAGHEGDTEFTRNH